MKTDRELLELAAKAAGIEVKRMEVIRTDGTREGFIACWNPLTDDGDALRLAVAIRWLPTSSDALWVSLQPDPYAATRRAIVRAAAAIGEQKP